MTDDLPDEYDPDEAQALERPDLTVIVDGLLRAHRPDRYEPGADWLDDVATKIENKITIIEAKRLAARQIVGQREGRATRAVNKFLKSLGAGAGGFSIDQAWIAFADEPVAFIEGVGEESAERRVRVALRAMRSEDWKQFALYGRADAQHRFAAEMAMYDAADWLAAQQGSALFADWATGAQVVKDGAA